MIDFFSQLPPGYTVDDLKCALTLLIDKILNDGTITDQNKLATIARLRARITIELQ